jgi:hypothetical protein
VRALDRVVGGLLAHHQAGAGQNAVAEGKFDGFVDGDVDAEIIGIDDQPSGFR